MMLRIIFIWALLLLPATAMAQQSWSNLGVLKSNVDKHLCRVDTSSGNPVLQCDGFNPYITATGQLGVSTTSVDASLTVDIEGNIGALNYCDETGNNCFVATDVGAGGGLWTDNTTHISREGITAVSGTYTGTSALAADLEGVGTRMFFDPTTAAFRAGSVNGAGAQWDDSNMGIYSTAIGLAGTASGDYSTALGLSGFATGNYSTAMGRTSYATGNYSTSLGGQGRHASGDYSTSLGGFGVSSGGIGTASTGIGGRMSTALGISSTVIGGYYATASGTASTAMGYITLASGTASTVMGYKTIASGFYSSATGYFSQANGLSSFAFGNGIQADGDYSVAIGLSNAVSGTSVPANTMAVMGGTVGISTTTPAATLEVAGTVNVGDDGSACTGGNLNSIRLDAVTGFLQICFPDSP